jgi:uncharacterized cofD-like protein
MKTLKNQRFLVSRKSDGFSKKIVVIGGGTGSFTVLKGLKKYDADITAVVSMFDSGGSTGKLRDEFGILPPGDVRRCLVALAQENGSNTVRDLFNFRFEDECSLRGHSFGNLLLTALTQITGSEVSAIEKASRILNIKGRVLPVSVDHAHLIAELENGELIVGETNIDIPKHDANLRIKRVFLEPAAMIYEETRKAIEEADLIVLGPGDLYTSVIPNLLVQGVGEAVKGSKAKKVYVSNVMTKWGETNGFSAANHARALLEYLPGVKLDVLLCNGKKAHETVLAKYAKEHAFPVAVGDGAHKYASRVIVEDLILQPLLARHDSEKLARVLVDL